jgi:hypothetical protein
MKPQNPNTFAAAHGGTIFNLEKYFLRLLKPLQPSEIEPKEEPAPSARPQHKETPISMLTYFTGGTLHKTEFFT